MKEYIEFIRDTFDDVRLTESQSWMESKALPVEFLSVGKASFRGGNKLEYFFLCNSNLVHLLHDLVVRKHSFVL